MPERATERHRDRHTPGAPERREWRAGWKTGAGQSEANSEGASYASDTGAHSRCRTRGPPKVCGAGEHGAPPLCVTALGVTTPPGTAPGTPELSGALKSAVSRETAEYPRSTALRGAFRDRETL